MSHPKIPRQMPGLQQPRSGRVHPYPCHHPENAARARLGPLAWWLAWGFALAALVAAGAAWTKLDAMADARLRFEYCTNVRLGVWPDYRNRFAELCEAPRVTNRLL